ncbi:MATE family efflux transporter [Bacillota bacterium]
MNSEQYNLTEGGILKKLLFVAVPIMGTQLMQMAYNLTDIFWLGRMEDSVTAVAASGLGGMFLWLSVALMMIGRMGAEIGTSQNIGRRHMEAARSFAQDSMRISFILGLLYGAVLILFAGTLVSLLQVKEALLFDSTCTYLSIIGFGIPFTYVSAAITGAFNGAGNSRIGFLANATGLVINMLLDPLMILGFDWGIKGAAIATVIAQMTVLLLFLWFVKRHPQRPFEEFKLLGKIDKDRFKIILGWSIPVAMESGAFTLLSMVVTAMISAWYGEIGVAVHEIGTQIESMSWLIGTGFSSAITAFIGQNYGAEKWDRIRKAYKLSLGLLLTWEVIVTIILVFGGRFLFSIFLSNPAEILDMGAVYLRILAASQVFMGLEGVCAGIFRGLGKTLPPSLCSIASNILRPIVCWIFAQWIGMNGLWLGIAVTASLRGLSMFVWFTIYSKGIPRGSESGTE